MRPPTDPATHLARRVARGLLRPLVRARGLVVEGEEHLPRAGERVLLCCNHAAYADTVLLASAIRPTFVVLGAKPRLFRDPARRALLRVAMIGRLDGREAFLADGQALLDDGWPVLVYPELGRFPEGPGPFSTWPAELALAAGAPIVPVHLRGTTRGDPRPVRVRAGPRLPPVGAAAALTATLRDAVLALR